MSVYITSSESRLAAKWMSDLDRSRRNWIWKRWLMLILAVVILLGVIAMTLMMDNKMPPTRFDENFEDETVTPLMIKSYVDERNVYFYNQAFTTIQIFVWSSLGVLLGLGCILQWERHTRDALILKILRQEMQNEIQIMPDDTERPLDILLVEDNELNQMVVPQGHLCRCTGPGRHPAGYSHAEEGRSRGSG